MMRVWLSVIGVAHGSSSLPPVLLDGVTNAPNPFDSRRSGLEGQTRLAYRLAADADVQVTLYDLLGHRVREWRFSPSQPGGQAGTNELIWDGTNERGQKVSKGGYLALVQMQSPLGSAKTIRKIAVIH